MKRLILLATILLSAGACVAEAPQLKNAKLEQRSAAGGFEQQVKAINGPAWIGYSVPAIAGNHNMCCYSGHGESSQACCGTCGLEKQSSYFEGRNANCPDSHLEGVAEFYVFIRKSRGQVDKVKMFSPNCQIDAGGMPVIWFTNVKPEQSVAYLASIAESTDSAEKDERVEGAIAAVAMHQDSAADQALARFMAPGHGERTMEQASFWAGTLRGTRGYEMLTAALERNEDTRFRKHAVFGLSQNSDPRAQDKLIDLARHDPASEVRSESIFWLAQAAGKKVAGVITSAIEDDPNTEVKKKAVFALSQLPEEEGIPLLIGQAEKNANPVVRKEAMFWLGQSGDQRALDYIASVLQR